MGPGKLAANTDYGYRQPGPLIGETQPMLASHWSILAGRRRDPHNRSVSPILQTRFKPKLAIVVRKYYPHSAPSAAPIPKQQPG